MALLSYQQALRFAARFAPKINTAQIALDIEQGKIVPVFVARRVYRLEDIEAACKAQVQRSEDGEEK
jgi:hypothetical protein